MGASVKGCKSDVRSSLLKQTDRHGSSWGMCGRGRGWGRGGQWDQDLVNIDRRHFAEEKNRPKHLQYIASFFCLCSHHTRKKIFLRLRRRRPYHPLLSHTYTVVPPPPPPPPLLCTDAIPSLLVLCGTCSLRHTFF